MEEAGRFSVVSRPVIIIYLVYLPKRMIVHVYDLCGTNYHCNISIFLPVFVISLSFVVSLSTTFLRNQLTLVTEDQLARSSHRNKPLDKVNCYDTKSNCVAKHFFSFFEYLRISISKLETEFLMDSVLERHIHGGQFFVIKIVLLLFHIGKLGYCY